MQTISLRLNEKDNDLIRKYAQLHGESLSDFIRNTLMEKIENEYDLQLFNKVWEEQKNQKTYSLEETKKELGLDYDL